MEKTEFPPILKIEQAERLLQLERHIIYRMVQIGELPAFKAGKAIRFSRDRLLEVVYQGTKPEFLREVSNE